jgi:hypothetical protein
VLEAVSAHRIRPPGVSGPLFVDTSSDPGEREQTAGSDPVTRVLARHVDGTCVFLERRGLCAIHRTAGVQSLPTACRHFPREILIDAARGILISLSHFCPTAANLLFSTGSLDVVEAHPPLSLEPPVEGLDATAAIAPLVRPGLLSDPEGYDAWERAALATLARPDCTARQAVDLIAAATEEVRSWQPRDGSLAACVGEALPVTRAIGRSTGGAAGLDFAELCAAHFPPAAGPVADFDRVWDRLIEPSMELYDRPLRNYLGTRLFGTWMAYEGRGLRSTVEWLRTALAVFRNELARRSAASGSPPARADVVEAFRTSDLLLLHTIDSEALARTFASLEGPEPA